MINHCIQIFSDNGTRVHVPSNIYNILYKSDTRPDNGYLEVWCWNFNLQIYARIVVNEYFQNKYYILYSYLFLGIYDFTFFLQWTLSFLLSTWQFCFKFDKNKHLKNILLKIDNDIIIRMLCSVYVSIQ